jgi:hypothetical protein
MDTFGWVLAIVGPISVAVALLVALRRHRREYREFLEPALAEHGLRFVSSEYPEMFKTGPFPKFEILPLRTWVNVLGISGQYFVYRIVTFQNPAGRPHQVWANLQFEVFRLRRIRWRAENEDELPEAARALLKEEARMGDAMRVTKIVVRVFGVISLLSSFAFLALGASCYNRAAHFKKTAVKALGTVIELKEDSSGGAQSHTVYYPIIRFVDKAGQEHTLYSSSGSYPPAYEVGEHVSVLYDPANPKEAKVNTFSDLWLWPLILGIFGGCELLAGLFLLFAVPPILGWAERRTVKPSSQ